jgi:excinuclease ABC subunit C
LDYIREATLEQLKQVEGIGDRLAKEIYQYFHP